MDRRSKLLSALAAAFSAAALIWCRWPTPAPAPAAPATAATPAPAAASAPTPSPAPAAAAPVNVRRLGAEERKQLGDQIHAAIAKVRAERRDRAIASARVPTRAEEEDPVIPLEHAGKPLQDALTASIPLLASCYEHAGSATPKTAAASMAMVSDPDLGTVIDTATITGADGKPLDRQLDDCLRDQIDGLALPPLGEPGKLQIQYTFKFD